MFSLCEIGLSNDPFSGNVWTNRNSVKIIPFLTSSFKE